jgi:hypothetical protein
VVGGDWVGWSARDGTGTGAMRRDVFISYAEQDKSMAERLCDEWEAAGIDCWIAPRDIPPGDIRSDAITNALASCRFLVLVLSKNANNSRQVLWEIERALERGMSIAIIQTESVQPEGALSHLVSEVRGKYWFYAYAAEPNEAVLWLDDVLHPRLSASIDRIDRSVESPEAPLGVGAADDFDPLAEAEKAARRAEEEKRFRKGFERMRAQVEGRWTPEGAPQPATTESAPSSPMAPYAPVQPEGSLSHTQSAASVARRKPVEFGVSYPSGVTMGVPFLVDAWVFPKGEREQARARAHEAATEPVGFRSGGSSAIAHRETVIVRLDAGPWEVRPAVQRLLWSGSLANVSFGVTPMQEVPGGKAIGTLTFLVKGLRIAELKFELRVGAGQEARPFTLVSPVQQAFASYASKDRSRVLARVQGMEKLGINVFVDVRNLKSNDAYPAYLLRQIESSDVLYLFWSRHAKESAWVEREWRHGLQMKGVHFIDPVPLTDPRKVQPPAELAGHKHFNDWTLAYIEYEKALSVWRRLGMWLGGH